MNCKKTGYDFWEDVLGSPRYVAAPMVDMSELAFRELCRRYNTNLCYSPMLHSQQFLQDLLYRSDNFSTSPEDRPLIVQFCANDPDTFVASAALISDKCDGIDLNLGCPQAIAKKGHYGAFLQDEWGLIQSIVRKAADELPVPVTCKMRILPKPSVRSVEYAKMLEDAGCSVLTVHGRTRFQKGHDTGLASWDVIRDIKQNVGIPVIANGNILSYSDVQACLKHTGADAVMSAEGLLHNPALFSGTNPPVWEIAEEYLCLAEKHETPLRHVRNHMYRIMYLCLYRDSKARMLLEDASGFPDFYSICDYLKQFPVKEHLSEKDVFCSLDFCEKPLDEFDLAELFTPCTLSCSSDESVCKSFDTKSSATHDNIDVVQIVDNIRSVCQTLEIEDSHRELVEELTSTVPKFLPVWLCHSRPRITNSGNRGCYSKYFLGSELHESKEENCEGIYLSKRQRRKARHYERVIAAVKENRKSKKMRRKQKILELKESNRWEDKPRSAKNITRKQLKQAVRQRLISARENSPKVCIDLGFSSEMSMKELHRLSSQLRRLYGSNRHSEKPFHLYFCNFSKSDPLFDICVLKNDGFSSYVVDMVERSPEEMFSLDDLVYLSPDSDNVLTDVDISKVYVIGGLVDDTVRKGLTLSRATHIEVKTARLPILEHLVRNGHKSGTTVLTVNQVFDVLLKFYETEDWLQALNAGVPSRKGFCVPECANISSTVDVRTEANASTLSDLDSSVLASVPA